MSEKDQLISEIADAGWKLQKDCPNFIELVKEFPENEYKVIQAGHTGSEWDIYVAYVNPLFREPSYVQTDILKKVMRLCEINELGGEGK